MQTSSQVAQRLWHEARDMSHRQTETKGKQNKRQRKSVRRQAQHAMLLIGNF